MVKSIRFEGGEDPEEVYFDIVVDTGFSEQELQAEAEAIVDTFGKKGKDDWNFEDVIREMENKGFIKKVEHDTCIIRL